MTMSRQQITNQRTGIEDFGQPKPLSMSSLDLSQRRAKFEATHSKGISA
jgi:hypothetical protein